MGERTRADPWHRFLGRFSRTIKQSTIKQSTIKQSRAVPARGRSTEPGRAGPVRGGTPRLCLPPYIRRLLVRRFDLDVIIALFGIVDRFHRPIRAGS